MENVFQDIVINVNSYPSASCKELAEVVDYLVNSPNWWTDRQKIIAKKMAITLEKSIVKEDFYLYSKFLDEKIQLQNREVYKFRRRSNQL